MKVVHVELPDKMVAELDALVKSGWFVDEAEIVRQALADFVEHRGFALSEQFQREDIAWALRERVRDE
jgi:Arc/MetJ-type ribon-helix-helix transcriptional regulator